MARTAKRGISTAAVMAACVVCLVVAAAMVMVPVRALAHRQADQPPPSHAPVDSVSIDAAWDAARVSDVALADDFSQRSPAHTGQLADMGQAGHLDAGSLLGVHVPADVRRDACAGVAACATRDPMVVVRSRPGQASVVLEHGVAGPAHPSRRMAMPRTRVVHAGGHVAAIRAVGAVWHRAVTSTRLVWPVDALSHSCWWSRSSAATCIAASPSSSTLTACTIVRLSSRLQRVLASPIRHAVRARAPKSGHSKSALTFASTFVGCSLIA